MQRPAGPAGCYPAPVRRPGLVIVLALGAGLGAGSAGCARDLGLDDQRFACSTDADCIRGTVCDPLARVCAAPHDLRPPDAGADAGVSPEDAGIVVRPDAAPIVIEWGDVSQPARAWWLYTDLDAPGVDAKLVEHGARIVDLEAEGEDDAIRYAVVLVENTEGVEQWWLSARPARDVIAGYTPLRARPVDAEPVRTGTISSYAVVLQRDAFSRAGRFVWWLTTAAGVEAKAVDTGYTIIDADRRFDGRYTALMEPPGAAVVTWQRELGPQALADRVASGALGLTHVEREAPQLFSVLTSTCPCVRSALVYDLDEPALRAEAAARRARIERFDTYVVGGVRRFVAILVDDGG